MVITRDTRSLDYSSCKGYRGAMKGLCTDCTAKNPSYTLGFFCYYESLLRFFGGHRNILIIIFGPLGFRFVSRRSLAEHNPCHPVLGFSIYCSLREFGFGCARD